METMARGSHRHRRRSSGSCDGNGAGSGRLRGVGRSAGSSKDDASLATRTAMRAVIAAGTYVAQDVRDRDGLTRPMLRRAALRMLLSRQAAMRRLGGAYLHADPPAREELPAGLSRHALAPGAGTHPQVIDVDAATVVDAGDGAGRERV